MRSKKERLAIFYARLAAEPAAASHDEARALLERVLNAVENEFSGVPYEPESMERMYPPMDDNQRAVSGNQGIMRYRSKGNYTYIGANGAISITGLEGESLFSKAGADGQKLGGIKGKGTREFM